MLRRSLWWFLGLTVLGILGGTMVPDIWGIQTEPPNRDTAARLFQSGNWKDAYAHYQKLLLDPRTAADRVGDDLEKGVQCLNQLGRIGEFDELVEGALAVRPGNWRFLRVAAQQYLQVVKHGAIVAGKFERGRFRGGGRQVQTMQRDRVRALQLLQQALPLAMADDQKTEAAALVLHYAEAWRRTPWDSDIELQGLTDLNVLPDYEERQFFRGSTAGAPVDEAGNPVYYRVPASWDKAQSDGERWRWLLEQAVELSPSLRDTVQWQLADYWWEHLDVHTLQQGFSFRPATNDEQPQTGTFALHTLAEDETIARLAIGVRRFQLPPEFNYIRILQELVESETSAFSESALRRLAEIFENRRQYPRAATYWRLSITRHGPGPDAEKQKRLEQIVGNWGSFESVRTQGAGSGATVEFRFRNARSVSFEAQAIDVARLLSDVKAYLKSSPRDLDWNQIQIENIGWRLVQENQSRYLGAQVAGWTQKLDPREGHLDRRITVTTPLRDAGAYLLTARVAGGNACRIVLWVEDTALIQKNVQPRDWYAVVDAVTGQPVPGANVEFFGWRQEQVRNGRPRIITTNFAEKTDAEGQLFPDSRRLLANYQWLAIARTPGGRLAFLGFHGIWGERNQDPEYNQVKVFPITDRPVYRPQQPVHFKFWVRRAQYDNDRSDFAGHEFLVELHNPRGEKVREWKLKADPFGGLEGTWDIPAGAMLGNYQLLVAQFGGGSFRVEEYKKPEFEVEVKAPEKPVALGEKITARISARYYFGSPVTQATVKYKVLRHEHDQDFFPIAPWDWCFGKGYWWFAYDYDWYPGWSNWVGCIRPFPWWRPFRHQPPEVVAEREVPLGEDGTVAVEIDTQLAKELHGDHDHKYTITAEVRDQSRRTIVGEGSVIVARQPFKVFTWVDQGYFRTGETIQAHFRAQTPDQKPVTGAGRLRLLRITYREQAPVETEVQAWDLPTDAEGNAQLPIEAAASGQYRLSYTVTDAAGHAIEGGYLFTVIGSGFDGRDYRFNHLELIPDRREYQPGETVRLQINTDRPQSTVYLFVRPASGVYQAPQVLHLAGKSTIAEIAVVRKDMPNFFIEAVTVTDGQVHRETKEIVVPPEKRVLQVAVTPSGLEYKPGESAKVKIRVTDFQGENFIGSTVVAIYDKAVEYISGGSNVEDIREFFWKWRRHHQPQETSSLNRHETNLTKPDEIGMSAVGIFGWSAADDLEGQEPRLSRGVGARSRLFGMGGGLEGAIPPPAAMAPMAAAAEASVDAFSAKAAPGGEAAAAVVTPTVRSQFADTALWVGRLDTDQNGEAEVSLKMPENLTTWKVKVWGMGTGTQVGSGEAEVVTRKNLLVRLQAPRFLVQNDEVVLSANVHNYLASAKQVEAVLELDGNLLQPLGSASQKIQIPANGEQRVDWRVAVREEGLATIRMKALTDEESDAMEIKVPVLVHGMLKTESWAGTVRPDQDRGTVRFQVPAARRPAQSVLEVRYSPTLAAAMVDALPYLVDYPYGCTEQTLNRFLPTVITQRVLLEMNLNLARIRDKRTNLNAQEVGADQERAAQWKRRDRNPVFDQEEVTRMVQDGLTALTDMQCADGGWGWFSGFGERSWPHTTAVVVAGLQVARSNDVAIVPGVLENGVGWLKRYEAEQIQLLQNAASEKKPFKTQADHLDAYIHLVLAEEEAAQPAMREFLYRDRNHLSVQAKALFALALHRVGDAEKLTMLRQNLEQYLVQDLENQTAYLRLPAENAWWYWYGSDIEANACYLRLLARLDPRGEVAPRLVKYLLNNRKHATWWNSTRDTATCITAFAEFLRASGETQPNMVVEVWLDGQKRQEERITAENLFEFRNKLVLTGSEVATGEHVLEIRRQGTGPVYFNTYLTNFTLEDPIQRAGLEIRVERKFYRLIPEAKQTTVAGSRGQAIRQREEKFRRAPLAADAVLQSGDLVEVELELESKNDYEYLVFEDWKGAGLEPVDLRSGYTNNGIGAYTEFRDDRVTFFVRALPRGRHSMAYRLRAETPGRFSALPATGSAMYAPELRGNSDEGKWRIAD